MKVIAGDDIKTALHYSNGVASRNSLDEVVDYIQQTNNNPAAMVGALMYANTLIDLIQDKFVLVNKETFLLGAKQISDLLTTAFENNSHGWLVKVTRSWKKKEEAEDYIWYAEAENAFKGFVGFEDEDEDGTLIEHVIDADKIVRGTYYFYENYPHCFRRVISQEYDIDDADIWLQCIFFGEVKYC